MKLKKVRKSGKMRGSRTCGRAAKKSKGSGNRGGKGMAGTGKKAGQRKTYVEKYLHPYFGRMGYTKGRGQEKGALVMNIEDIEKKLNKLLREGKAKKGKEGIEINLDKYKILGNGEVKEKMIIKAKSFSGQAKQKIEKAGGKAVAARQAVRQEAKPEELSKKEEANKEIKKEEKAEVKKEEKKPCLQEKKEVKEKN